MDSSQKDQDNSKSVDDASILEKKLSDLENELTLEKEAKLLALADFDNYRKRVEKDRQDMIIMANISILRAIADVIDDFERLVNDLNQPDKEDAVDAFKNVLDKIKGILMDFNVIDIKVEKGAKMDPKIMEAIGTVAVNKEEENNQVIEVVQKGYKFQNKDMMVRPARVIIKKYNK